MQRMDASSGMHSRSSKIVYSPHHQQRHPSMGVVGGLSGGYGLFSPGGRMSPFYWDTSAFRFDFDDLRARSNLLSLSSSIRDADETEIRQKTSAEEELEGTGRSVGRSRNDDEDKEGDDNGKGEEGKSQKRKGGTIPGGPDVEMKRFKLGVLRNLLTNFSLEKTIEKYRSLSSKQFTVRPGDYSFDCAVSAHQLKDKLFRLTGSDRIKINDRHFMQRMQKILEHEDEEKTKKGDDERADLEFQRLRKLMQHGVISAKEMQDDECLVAAQASAAAAAKSRRGTKDQRNRRTATYSKQSNPGSKQLTRRPSLRGSSQSTINSSMTAINRRPEDQSTNTLHLPAINIHSQSTINNASFSSFTSPSPRRAAPHVYKSLAHDFQSNILSGCLDRPRCHKEAAESKEKKTEPHYKSDFREGDGGCAEREESSSSSLPAVCILPAAGSSTGCEHPLIQKMRQEKSVKGLYELAATISKLSV